MKVVIWNTFLNCILIADYFYVNHSNETTEDKNSQVSWYTQSCKCSLFWLERVTVVNVLENKYMYYSKLKLLIKDAYWQ